MIYGIIEEVLFYGKLNAMKKFLFIVLVVSSYCIYANTGLWTSANIAYSKNNLANLSTISANNPNDKLVSYLNALANLNKNNPFPAIKFIKYNQTDNYFSLDLIHQLLNYYYNDQKWNNYLAVYRQLPENYSSLNETCGYDIANFATDNKIQPKSNYTNLISNKIPLWCVTLFASQLNNRSLNKDYQQPFLYSLIINDQLNQFNQLANVFHYPKLKFDNYNAQANISLNKYQTIYMINLLAKKSPELAYTQLSTAKLDNVTRGYLYNIIATNLAMKQNFNLASSALEKANDNYVSDEDYEWRARIYMALSDWQQVDNIISSMPDRLQTKNVWLYWRAFAKNKLGDLPKAVLILNKVPDDYSYYSLMARAELHKNLSTNMHLFGKKLDDIEYADDAKLSFALYNLARQTNNANFTRIATQNLYYIISQSNDQDIITISNLALTVNWNEMSIYAANKLIHKNIAFSFPLLYSQTFKNYAKNFGMEPSYPMAITRQESRFNPNALAFDGGVGLMQIMPDTAKFIAKNLGSPNCYKNYTCNIKFGSWYVSHLYEKFGRNIIYSTAGYNAGPNRAHRWQQAFLTMDNRVQIELIPFKITRDYVQKVITNKIIYDIRFNPGKSVNLLSYLKNIDKHSTTFINDDDNTDGAKSTF